MKRLFVLQKYLIAQTMASEHGFLKIVVTGPESSGKTLLAEALARVLGVEWVPEFARSYVAHLGHPYVHGDLRRIGAGQRYWEQWHIQRIIASAGVPLLICDTDWTVLHVWEQYRFQTTSAFHWQQGYGPPAHADLYLLCAPDFPWQPDPLREHPEERGLLFGMYERLLLDRDARYIVLRGTPALRLEIALAAIRKLL